MVEFLPVVIALLTAGLSGPGESPALNRPPVAVKRSARELLDAPDRPVRGTTHEAKELLARGLARSTTFGALMSALDGTDVIVYVEVTRKLPAAVAGRLLFATTVPGGQRYLRVQISPEGSRSVQVAALGHELQHAVEVALAPEVRDEDSLARFYQRIGTEGALPRSYDTVAAQLAGRRVLMEVEG